LRGEVSSINVMLHLNTASERQKSIEGTRAEKT